MQLLRRQSGSHHPMRVPFVLLPLCYMAYETPLMTVYMFPVAVYVPYDCVNPLWYEVPVCLLG